MTTTDLWIADLSSGKRLGQHGGLFSPALDVASVLLDLINAGKLTPNGPVNVTNIELRMRGHQLIEVFLETERQTGRTLTESNGRRSTDCVTPGHLYEVAYSEF